jgi:sortase A
VKGSSRPDLQKGPGWIEWTELPGPEGTSGIAGHRTTYLAPFRAIDQLKPGDRVRFYSPYRRYTYQVVRVVAVRPSETEIMDSGPEPMLNLSACHPPYSARQRLVAVSKLMEVKQLDQSK